MSAISATAEVLNTDHQNVTQKWSEADQEGTKMKLSKVEVDSSK